MQGPRKMTDKRRKKKGEIEEISLGERDGGGGK